MREFDHEPTPTQPVEDFSRCHLGIIKRLDELGQLPGLLEPAAMAREIAVNALEFFREVIFEHHQDEERELFPAVLASARKGEEHEAVAAMTKRLTDEHRELEATWRVLEAGLKKIARGHSGRIDASAIDHLVARYKLHAEFEEREFLPLAQAILGRNANHLAALGLSLHLRHAPRRPATYV